MQESDYAAILDVLTGVAPQVVEMAAPLMMTLNQSAVTVESTFTSRVQLTTSFASTCTVGVPYQGGMRQAAFDRWNYMYPS